MALNPYTLYSLYEKGILDYVPTDLAVPTPMGAMMPMRNPYLDMAMQGGLYQNHGINADSFQISSPYSINTQSYGNLGGSYSQLGALSNAGGTTAFSGYGVGVQSNAGGINAISGYGVGTKSNAGGMNAINGYGVGSQSPAGFEHAVGGFADAQNSINNGINTAASVFNRTPKIILGLAAGAIGVLGLMAAFKRGKKPPKTSANNTSFLSKLNPKNWNWFKKSSHIN